MLLLTIVGTMIPHSKWLYAADGGVGSNYKGSCIVHIQGMDAKIMTVLMALWLLNMTIKLLHNN